MLSAPAPSAARSGLARNAMDHLNKKRIGIKMNKLRILLAALALAAVAAAGHSAAKAASPSAKAPDCCPGGSCCTGGACCR